MVVQVRTSPFGIQSQRYGNGFDESGFPRTVFANDECDVAFELKFVQVQDGRDVVRVLPAILHGPSVYDFVDVNHVAFSPC